MSYLPNEEVKQPIRDSKALKEIIAKLDRLPLNAKVAGQHMLALLLEQTKYEAERRLAEVETRPPPERNG